MFYFCFLVIICAADFPKLTFAFCLCITSYVIYLYHPKHLSFGVISVQCRWINLHGRNVLYAVYRRGTRKIERALAFHVTRTSPEPFLAPALRGRPPPSYLHSNFCRPSEHPTLQLWLFSWSMWRALYSLLLPPLFCSY